MRKLEKPLIIGTITLCIEAFLLPDTFWFLILGGVNATLTLIGLFVYSGLYRQKYAYLFIIILLSAYFIRYVDVTTN